MKIIKTKIQGLLIIEPVVYEDERGYFFESFNRNKFLDSGIALDFVQDNESKSQKGVLRGLHFQNPPYAQEKLVRVIQGSVRDVVVDIRLGSPTYGQWESFLLSGENKMMIWIPEGMAHGFATLEDHTVFFYKCTKVYNKDSESCIRWNDPELRIDWGIKNPILSEKDKISPMFKDFKSQFKFK